MPHDPLFEVYPVSIQPRGGKRRTEYFWRFRAANGQISAVSGEGFVRREDAHRAIDRFSEALESVSSGTDAGAYIGGEIVDVFQFGDVIDPLA